MVLSSNHGPVELFPIEYLRKCTILQPKVCFALLSSSWFYPYSFFFSLFFLLYIWQYLPLTWTYLCVTNTKLLEYSGNIFYFGTQSYSRSSHCSHSRINIQPQILLRTQLYLEFSCRYFTSPFTFSVSLQLRTLAPAILEMDLDKIYSDN